MYIIDGHNLIPRLPGGSLRELDDEATLIALLQAFARVQRNHIHVFFDKAPPGHAGERNCGSNVTAHFVSAGSSADDAIRRMLVQQGKGARNLTVVTSDRAVQAEARAARAEVVSSDEFAHRLFNSGSAPVRPAPARRAPPAGKTPDMSSQELDSWYNVFAIDPAQAERPIEPEQPKKAPSKKGRGGKAKRQYGEPN